MIPHEFTNLNGTVLLPLPDAAKVTLISSTGGSVTGMLDETLPHVTDGYGGWTTIPRNRQVALTTWTGVNPFQLDFGIIFSAIGPYSQVSPGNTVEPLCNALSKMARYDRAKNQRPPSVTLESPGNLPFDDKTWVISALNWGDGYRQADTGLRTRQQVAITLLELVEDRTFLSLSPALTMRSATTSLGAYAVKGVHVVAQGETLASIAIKIGKKAGYAKTLQAINKIRDPLSIKPGDRIKLHA